MNKLLTRALLALAALLLPPLAGRAEACSCFAIPTPYQAYRDARAVFAGKVLGSRDVPTQEQGREGVYTVNERRLRFAVEEVFKGPKAAEIEVNAGRTDSTCYSGFNVGQSYLIYAYGDSDAALSVHACTRTGRLTHALDDVHYIRALLRGEPEPRVYGSLVRVDDDLSKDKSGRVTPIGGIRILVEGGGRRFEAVTDERGLYSFSGIPDGTYKARPLLPDKYFAYFPAEEEFILHPQEAPGYGHVHHGPSAFAGFNIGWKNEISGRILDAEGRPVRRARASLLSVRDPRDPPLVVEEAWTDLAEGKYRFTGLTPGAYVPCATVRAPFKTGGQAPRFCHPGAADPGRATPVRVQESGDETGKDIKLPAGYAVRQIEGVLVWPDGRPVARGWVLLAGKENPGEGDEGYDYTPAGDDGRFSAQGFAGAEYWVHATVGTFGLKFSSGKNLWDSGVRELKARPLRVIPGETNEPQRIVIPLPEGFGVPW